MLTAQLEVISMQNKKYGHLLHDVDLPFILHRAAPVNHAPLLLHSWVEGHVIATVCDAKGGR